MRKIAKVVMTRRLAVRLYWMWRKGWDYEQLKKIGSHAGQPGHRQVCQAKLPWPGSLSTVTRITAPLLTNRLQG